MRDEDAAGFTCGGERDTLPLNGTHTAYEHEDAILSVNGGGAANHNGGTSSGSRSGGSNKGRGVGRQDNAWIREGNDVERAE